MQLRVSARYAFTLIEIMIVVAIIGLLAAIAIPSLVRAKDSAQRTACITNLKSIDGMKSAWALDNHRKNTDTPTDTDLFGAGAYIRDKPQCPANGTYSLNQVDTKPTCSILSHTL